MSEFTSSFWDLYVAILSVVSIVACAVFLKSQSVRKAPGAAPTTGHTWDEDLAEYNNPLPRWWSWLFYITVVFAIAYLVLYPGLGSWRGMLGWSQVSQLEQETAAADKRFGPLYEKFAAIELEALAKNPEALAIGQKLFLNNCAQCHASDGAGSRGFPNLTDRDWLWGGEPKTIKATITDGRTGTMPPFGPALGAPNLTDRIWLHGSGEPAIIETITRGRSNQMPAHKDLLSEAKIHLLAAYVLSLSQPEK